MAILLETNLSGADLNEANLSKADLYGSDINGIENWRKIANITNTNIYEVKNAPDGFIEWAKEHGAISFKSWDVWRLNEPNKER
jgi:hypothetical protein